jgi:hypothetical protein
MGIVDLYVIGQRSLEEKHPIIGPGSSEVAGTRRKRLLLARIHKPLDRLRFCLQGVGKDRSVEKRSEESTVHTNVPRHKTTQNGASIDVFYTLF